MLKRKTNASPPNKGQGALEYLLLIGGAVLVATVVLVIILSTSGSTNTIISNNISTFQHQITLNAGTGGGANLCGTGSQVCATGSSQNCTTGGGYAGTQTCNTNCSGYNSCTTTLSCGDGTVSTPPEACEQNSDCTGTDVCTSCQCVPAAAPAFSFSTGTGSGAHQVDLTWNITSNYDGTAYNVVKGWETASAPAITDPVSFQSAASPAFSYNVGAASGSAIPAFGISSNVSYTVYMVACNSAGVTNSNCTLSSVQTPVSGYDAVLFEAETMTLQSGLQVTTQGANTFIHSISGSCTGANNATLPVTLDNSGSGSTNYELWGVVRNASNTSAYNFTRTIDPVANVSLSIPAVTTYTWFNGPTGAVAGNGSQTARVVIPCASGGLLLVDAILLTTDTACIPTGDGSNCA
jgi:hypothetical protein